MHIHTPHFVLEMQHEHSITLSGVECEKMVDVESSRLYEVLPMDVPGAPHMASAGKLSSSVPAGYSTYSVPRGVNGTPPTSRVIPPAVPPRNKPAWEGEGPSSLGSSPNDKAALFPPSRSKSAPQGEHCVNGLTC